VSSLANHNGVEAAPGNRALAGWEIASVVSSAFMAEWILAAAAGRSKLIVAIPLTLAFTFILVSHRLHRETLRDLGLRFDNFLRAVKLLLAPMLIVAMISLAIGLASGTRPDFLRWHAERLLPWQLAIGFAWGLVQEYVLQGFFNRRAQIIWGPGPLSILVTAIIFAALHFPNPFLMLVTFVGGLLWAFIYQRAPNLLALAVSHAVMTWVLVSTLPPSALNHLRIGFKYFA
jgi:membrane protease YdiL (CAAX protease family)